MKALVHITLVATLIAVLPPSADAARLKELVQVEGFRTNELTGIGLVVGLNGTGDDAGSATTRRQLANLIKKLGMNISEGEIKAKNIAAVLVTAKLPAFAQPGQSIDIQMSSIGSAKSLAGGTLVLTPLKGPDLRTYALAQGPITVGGFAVEGGTGSAAAKNHTTVATLPGGATLERPAPGALPTGAVTLLLRQADFTTAARIATVINASLGEGTAKVRDPGAVVVNIGEAWQGRTVELVAALERLEAEPDVPARVIVDERTGTIVVGSFVTLSPAAIAHGGITVRIRETLNVSQPGILSETGSTVTTPSSDVQVDEAGGQLALMNGTTTVGDLATALNALGVKPRDLVAIFEALRTAGALHAEIVVR